jgi:hypothetical protein
MVKIDVLLAAALAALALAGTASSFDRHPIVMRGLRPDGRGQTTTAAQRLLRERYAGVSYDYCVGVIMRGYPTRESYWSRGMTRAWDKLACAGLTYSGRYFTLIFDAKARRRWVIYRMGGTASTGDLQG